MRGTVHPRPAKRVDGKLAPMRANETWTDPDTGKVVTAGPNGSTWSWSFTTGSRGAGNRRTHTKGGYRTRKLAQAALTDALAAYGKGDDRPVMRADATPVGDYLVEWLAGLPRADENGRGGRRASTVDGYRAVIDRWLRPHIGRVPLRDLTARDLTDLYSTLRASGARGGRPLGSRSVQLAATVLRMALTDAVEAGKLAYNPADKVPRRQRPTHRAEKRAERFWTPEQARAFLDATTDTRLYPLWALALDTGARRGELSALRWESVDLDGSAVTIRASRTLSGRHVVEGPTKNGKPRMVDLDGQTVAALRAWRATQARDRLAAGEAWQGGTPGEAGYVFTDELGEPYRPDVLTRAFGEAQSGLGLPRMVFHAMRHTSASILIAAGVAITVVSARLGHSQVSITLDVYSHLMPNDGAAAAAVIGRALYGETGT